MDHGLEHDTQKHLEMVWGTMPATSFLMGTRTTTDSALSWAHRLVIPLVWRML